MARKAAPKAPKRVAPSKAAKKESRKEHFRKNRQDPDEEEQPSSEDENYLAFSKQQAESDDEDYGKEREVFQLNMNKGSDDDSDDASDDDEEDGSSGSDVEDDDDLQNLVNNLAPELRNKVLNQQSASESEEEADEEEDEEDMAHWGRKKKTYYSGDTADLEIGQDIEDALEEEEAAKDLHKARMKKMAAEDFLDSDDAAESANDEEEDSNTLAAQLARQSKRPAEVERVTKSLSHLSKAAKMDILAQSAPELVTLITDLRERVADLSARIIPLHSLAQALHNMGKASDDLVDYLQMKQQLMVAYCLDVVYYLYLKAKGTSVADHPVMRQMLRLRYAMEKVYSLDAKLQHQISRLLKLREQGVDAKMLESSMLKPNLQALLDEDDEEQEEGSEREGGRGGEEYSDNDMDEDVRGKGASRAQGVYRPPKLHSTPYPADEPSAKELRKSARASKRVQQSELFEALQEEFGVTPEEAASGGIANVSKDLKRLEQEEKERLAFEEERFVRMTLTKKEKQAIKRRTAEAMRIDNFEDIGDAGDLDNLLASQPVSGSKRAYEHSGDAAKALERAVRELGEKRSRRAAPTADFEDSAPPRHQHYVPSDDDEDGQGDGENLFEDFVSKKKAFLDAKTSHYTPAPTYAGHEEEVAEGSKRGASYEIIKNRGLTPHRKKENRNARVKKRVAYDQAVKRRKGQIREVGTRAEVGYQGELTGIKANLAHSRKLG